MKIKEGLSRRLLLSAHCLYGPDATVAERESMDTTDDIGCIWYQRQ